MTVQVIRVAQCPSTPWKNGGGTTREIAVGFVVSVAGCEVELHPLDAVGLPATEHCTVRGAATFAVVRLRRADAGSASRR